MNIKKITLPLKSLCGGCLICLIATLCWAAIAIQSYLVSGNIVRIEDGNTIRLDNGKSYSPSRRGLGHELQEGQPVTLRYVIEQEDKYVFFDFSPGLNSLTESRPAATGKAAQQKP
jgi:hypothetical protein